MDIRSIILKLKSDEVRPAVRCEICRTLGYEVKRRRHRGFKVGDVYEVNSNLYGWEYRIAIEAPRHGMADCVII